MSDAAALDALLTDLRDWEDSMQLSWTAADKALYFKKKFDNVNNFLMDQVNYWDKVMAERESGVSSAPPAEPEPEAVVVVATLTPRNFDEDEDREAKEAADRARAAADKAASDKAAADKAASDKAAADKAAADKLAAEKAAKAESDAKAAKAAADKAAADKAAADKLAAEKAAKAAADKAAADKAAAERAAKAAADAKAAAAARQPVDVAASNQADYDLNLATERKDAILRIGRPATKQSADLTDPSVLEAYIRIRNDRDPLNWFILGYAPGSNTKIVVIACGETGWEEMKAEIPEDAVFMYINYRFGDTQRSKFLFLTYVPDSLPGLKKSRVVGHRPAVEKLLKYMTLQWHVLDKSEMTRETLDKKLLSAGGANYSVQESNKGDFASYKQTTRDFYAETDKATQISGLVYDKGPLARETPMDLAGRSMVASQSEFRANIKDLNVSK